jgi:hypothetical protein
MIRTSDKMGISKIYFSGGSHNTGCMNLRTDPGQKTAKWWVTLPTKGQRWLHLPPTVLLRKSKFSQTTIIFLTALINWTLIMDTANVLCEVESVHLYTSNECRSSNGVHTYAYNNNNNNYYYYYYYNYYYIRMYVPRSKTDISCNWVITRWQWLFYMHTNMEKKVSRKFKLGGLHERHVVAITTVITIAI